MSVHVVFEVPGGAFRFETDMAAVPRIGESLDFAPNSAAPVRAFRVVNVVWVVREAQPTAPASPQRVAVCKLQPLLFG